MKKITPNEIYSLLKQRAEVTNIFVTDSDLGRMTGISRSQISDLKYTSKSFITRNTAVKVASFLNIPLEMIEYRDAYFLAEEKHNRIIKKSLFSKMLPVTILNFMVECRNECG